MGKKKKKKFIVRFKTNKDKNGFKSEKTDVQDRIISASVNLIDCEPDKLDGLVRKKAAKFDKCYGYYYCSYAKFKYQKNLKHTPENGDKTHYSLSGITIAEANNAFPNHIKFDN